MAEDGSKKRLGIALVLVGGFLVAGAALVIRAAGPAEGSLSAGLTRRTLNYPGLVRPPAAPAAAAHLADGDPVIGVVMDGRARAYPLAVLAGPRAHVVNDLVAGHPVTVTYCDVKNCTRVYTGDGDDPLDVAVGGYDDGLLLLINGHHYRQDTGRATEPADEPLPLAPLGFVRTTWKEWRAAHPDTDVVGG